MKSMNGLTSSPCGLLACPNRMHASPSLYFRELSHRSLGPTNTHSVKSNTLSIVKQLMCITAISHPSSDTIPTMLEIPFLCSLTQINSLTAPPPESQPMHTFLSPVSLISSPDACPLHLPILLPFPFPFLPFPSLFQPSPQKPTPQRPPPVQTTTSPSSSPSYSAPPFRSSYAVSPHSPVDNCLARHHDSRIAGISWGRGVGWGCRDGGGGGEVYRGLLLSGFLSGLLPGFLSGFPSRCCRRGRRWWC